MFLYYLEYFEHLLKMIKSTAFSIRYSVAQRSSPSYQ